MVRQNLEDEIVLLKRALATPQDRIDSVAASKMKVLEPKAFNGVWNAKYLENLL